MVIDWQLICTNPLTGRKVWIIREAVGYGEYGGPRTWSVVAVRNHYFAKYLHFSGAENLRTRTAMKSLVNSVVAHGYNKGTAIRRNRMKHYGHTGEAVRD